ncbi:Type IV leader peptidase family protein [Parapedobacter composti]|uniref:Type IV leader peptidase family protein n=1 Tax=Parapedobacter composti TaxID=623281 RepID=A0A1I1MHM2_9SPHI|nr:hypothetical protein [Parapedobacter composti]SFC82608.1 Type IV leader peptidase family protein [Parapedobacter composti]
MLLWATLVGLLAAVAWQDFRGRSVYALLFPSLVVIAVVHAMMLDVFSPAAVAANLAILAVQLIVLNLVMYWRKRAWLMQGEQWMGWGDVAFFVVLAFCFSTFNFVLFYVASLLVVLLGALLAMAFGVRVATIPLAGGQAALLVLLLLADGTHLGRHLYVDAGFIPYF